MGKKTRAKAAPAGENPRRPCPCGSGKRYKACHGAGDDVIVIRPFEGLAAECDLVAMREFLPSATAPLPLREHPGLGRHLVKEGREIHVWTVNTEADLDLCLDLGVTAVITDRPAHLLELLDDRA